MWLILPIRFTSEMVKKHHLPWWTIWSCYGELITAVPSRSKRWRNTTYHGELHRAKVAKCLEYLGYISLTESCSAHRQSKFCLHLCIISCRQGRAGRYSNNSSLTFSFKCAKCHFTKCPFSRNTTLCTASLNFRNRYLTVFNGLKLVLTG